MITIYKIYDMETGEVLYVGSTCKEPLVRFNQHQKELSSGVHKNKRLQKEYEARNCVGYEACLQCEETLINRYVLEYIVTSVLRPICNRVFNMSRTKRAYNMRLINKELAEKLLEVLDEYKLNVI